MKKILFLFMLFLASVPTAEADSWTKLNLKDPDPTWAKRSSHMVSIMVREEGSQHEQKHYVFDCTRARYIVANYLISDKWTIWGETAWMSILPGSETASWDIRERLQKYYDFACLPEYPGSPPRVGNYPSSTHNHPDRPTYPCRPDYWCHLCPPDKTSCHTDLYGTQIRHF